MFNRKFVLLFVLLALCAVFSFATIIRAQEATAEPPPDIVVVAPSANDAPVVVLPERDETLKTALILGGAFVLVILLPTLFGLIFLAYNHLPSWAQALVYENRGWIRSRVDEGTDRFVDFSRTTKNTLDDGVADYINTEVDRRVDEKIAAWEAQRSGTVPGSLSAPHR